MFLSFKTLLIFSKLFLSDYIEYHENINRAELYCTDNRLAEALNIYQETFAQFERAFGKDYYNAALCSVLLGKDELAYNYLFKLAKKGLNITFIENTPEFSRICTNKSWSAFRTTYLQEYSKFYKKHQSLRLELERLAEDDQLYRKERDQTGVPIHKDKLFKVDSINTYKLLRIIEDLGEFPGEDVVGLGDSLRSTPSFHLVILHQSKYSGNQVFNFSDIVRKAINEGEILPSKGSNMIYLNEGGNFYFDYIFKLIYTGSQDIPTYLKEFLSKWLYKSKLHYNFEEIDHFRKSNGLPSLKDHIKKVAFQFNNKSSFDLTNGLTFKSYKTTDIPTIERLVEISSIYDF